jgi:hypothetical protein
MLAREERGAFDVILVLMRQKDGIDGARKNAYGCQASLELFTGESGIDQNVLRAVGDKGDVAAASASKYRD